eukprot:COSAG01_NODE_3771_length_5712_cov_49.079102_4_plen_54_part_00
MQVNGTAWNGLPGGRAEAIMCSYAAFDGVPSWSAVPLNMTQPLRSTDITAPLD